MWLIRDLSLKGRVLLSKTEGLSCLIYPAKILDVPKIIINKIDSTLFNFLWWNEPHTLNRNVLCKSDCKGGLNMIDFHSSNIVLKLNLFKHCIQNKDKLWYLIPNPVFGKLGGIEFPLKCDFDMNKLPVQISSFHSQALLCWLLIYKHNFFPHNFNLEQ